MMRRLGTVCLSVLVLVATTVIVAPPQANALPAGCHKSDKFGPSIKSMQHFARCLLGHPAQVVWAVNTTAAATAAATPDSGGPSCEWADAHIAKWCYSKGVAYIICDQYFIGATVFGHHCKNTYYDSGQSFADLWKHVKNVFHNHVLRRCSLGGMQFVSGQVVTAVIVRGAQLGAGMTGPVGLAVGFGVGCVYAGISYWWH
jgi:hypothetical protein